MTLFEQIGGDALRRVIEDFYDRVFRDVMIGFLFVGKDRARLVDKEWELAARMLGSTEIRYTGRPIREAHAKVPILGGHFDRRTKILEETLDDHGVPPEVRDAWLGHTRALRSQVTADVGSECDHDAALSRIDGDD